MKKMIALKPFSWAHRGVEVQEFQKDERFETEDEDLVKVSTDEGWAKEAKAEK